MLKRMLGAVLVLACSASFAVNQFELPLMNGNTTGQMYSSSTVGAKVYVVEAYFLGCPYCNDNAENVNNLAAHYMGDSRVQVLDVGIDTSDSSYATWIKRHNPNHPVLKDSRRVLISQLGTSGYPSTYVLDKNLKVVKKTSGVWSNSTQNSLIDVIDGLLEQGE